MVYWRGKHWDCCSGSSGINQGHADTVQGIGRTVPVHAVTEMEERIERIEGEVMEERNMPPSKRAVRECSRMRAVKVLVWNSRMI